MTGYRRREEEALTEMALPKEDDTPPPEDDFSRLMKKIRRTREEKEEAEVLEKRQEESRLKNLDEIDRRLTEKIRTKEPEPEKGSTSQEAALVQAKQTAVNEKLADIERQRQREEKYRRQTKRHQAKHNSHRPYEKQIRRGG